MLLLITGLVLLALGLFAGGVLVAAPLGLLPYSPGAVLWVLFPVFSVIGYVLFVIGGKNAQVRSGSVIVSSLLLLLALASAVALVLQAAAIVQPQGSTLSLWYVLLVAGMVGVVGAGALARSPAEA